jgi:hypothetical protein
MAKKQDDGIKKEQGRIPAPKMSDTTDPRKFKVYPVRGCVGVTLERQPASLTGAALLVRAGCSSQDLDHQNNHRIE